MKTSVRAFVWSFAGVLLAALLSLGAFAIADSRIGGPRERPLLRPIEPTAIASASREPKPSKDDVPDQPTSSASPGDAGEEPGDDNSGHGSEPGDDNSGEGSDGDSSGHGSADGPDDD
jgi:hypothetical protein